MHTSRHQHTTDRSNSGGKWPLPGLRRAAFAGLALAVGLGGVGCGSTAQTDPVETEGPSISRIVVLALTRPVDVGGIELTWTRIQDSRCPRGAQCVWEGEVRIWLQVTGSGARSREIEMALGAGRDPSEVSVFDRTLRLLSVEPAPVAGGVVEEADVRARIEVSSE